MKPVKYLKNLPIYQHLDEIRELWTSHQVIIVGGATGSGKTTQLPKVALELGWTEHGIAACTQPRRIAATAMARRVAAELGVEYGREVGSQVRFEDCSTAETKLKFMTDGILLSSLREDPLLRRYSVIMLDEVHERSLNIDFLLGVLHDLLPKRPDLKVAVASATLETARFQEFFHGAPAVAIEGRTYPIEDIFLPPYPDEELPESVARGVEELLTSREGDILVFLPGEREIRESLEMLRGRNYGGVEVLPLYARLSTAEQQKVFHPGRARRIILSTNVAETSLTIPRISCCIDSGLARISRYNPRTHIQELRVEMISQASIRQRRGRCGRISEGTCLHLYSESDMERADAYTDPEIRRTGLAGVILQMAALKLPDIREFPLPDPPESTAVREGLRTLYDIDALSPERGITPDGRLLAKLPADPQLGRMILAASKLKVIPELLVIAAGLSLPELRERPLEKQQAADQAHAAFRDDRSDFTSMLKLWNALDGAAASNRTLRKFCEKNFLNFTRAREWRNLVPDLAEVIRYREPVEQVRIDLHEQVHEAVLSGIPRHIARYDRENKIYLAATGRKFVLFPGSGLARRKQPPEWVVVSALMETARVYGRVAAEVAPETLLHCAGKLCTAVCDQEHFEPKSGFVRAREKIYLGGLVIFAGRQIDYAKRNPAAAREIFIREGLLAGEVDLPGTAVHRFQQRRERLLELELRRRRPDSLYDEAAASEFFHRELPPEVNSVTALKNFLRRQPRALRFAGDAFQQEEPVPFRPEDFPDQMRFSGVDFRLSYVFDPGSDEDGVTLYSPEDRINLLPRQLLAWPVDGFLPEVSELWLRALPKDLRRRLGGLAACAALLAEHCRTVPLLREKRPGEVIAAFLAQALDMEADGRIFDEVRLPAAWQLKLGILNENGRLRERVTELPAEYAGRSTVRAAGLAGAGRHCASGLTAWPAEEGTLPLSVEIPAGSGHLLYPALTPGAAGTADRQLFLKSDEAALHHRRGTAVLLYHELNRFSRLVRRDLKISNEVKLDLLLNYREEDWSRDLLLSSLTEAAERDLAEIRTETAFRAAAERAAGNWSRALTRQVELLGRFAGEVSAIRHLGRRCGAGEVLTERLDWLFAAGFIRRPGIWEEYPRYLKALKLRAERLAGNPGKDAQKAADLSGGTARLLGAAASVPEWTLKPGLVEFYLLLEESHIAVFAPEIRTKIKNPVSRLDECWKRVTF